MTWPPHQMAWHASKQVTSPPWNSRRLVHSKEMVWASRWSVAHSIGKFFLCYIILFSSETSAPGSPGNYLYLNIYICVCLFVCTYVCIILHSSLGNLRMRLRTCAALGWWENSVIFKQLGLWMRMLDEHSTASATLSVDTAFATKTKHNKKQHIHFHNQFSIRSFTTSSPFPFSCLLFHIPFQKLNSAKNIYLRKVVDMWCYPVLQSIFHVPSICTCVFRWFAGELMRFELCLVKIEGVRCCFVLLPQVKKRALCCGFSSSVARRVASGVWLRNQWRSTI